MDDPLADDRTSGNSPRAPRANMECIGSFHAFTQDGEQHTVEVWTYFRAVHNREHQRIEPSCLYLMTTDGHDVDRVDQGEYRLKDNPEVSLSSDDPHAP